MNYYLKITKDAVRGALVRAAASLMILTRTGPVKAYDEGVRKIMLSMEGNVTMEGHIIKMPGADGRIESLHEYVVAYLRRPFKKNFIQRAKWRVPKIQYVPHPHTPIQRQAVNPLIVYFLNEKELDEYSEYQAIIDGAPENGPDINDSEAWNEYWVAREKRDDLGALALKRVREVYTDEVMREAQADAFALSNLTFANLKIELDALTVSTNEARSKRLTTMKASKYLAAAGKAV